jgi:hypothetical protein
VSDKAIMPDIIKARHEAQEHAGTPLGAFWADRLDDLFRSLSPAAQVMLKLDTPDENIGD